MLNDILVNHGVIQACNEENSWCHMIFSGLFYCFIHHLLVRIDVRPFGEKIDLITARAAAALHLLEKTQVSAFYQCCFGL